MHLDFAGTGGLYLMNVEAWWFPPLDLGVTRFNENVGHTVNHLLCLYNRICSVNFFSSIIDNKTFPLW